MSDPHELERQQRRADPGCADPAQPETCAVQLPQPFRRLADPCGDIVLPDPCTIDPTKFQKGVAPALVAAAAPPALPVVQVFNGQATATCAEQPGAGGTVQGADVVVAAAALQQDVSLGLIEDLTVLQRAQVAALDQSTLNSFVSLTALQIAQATSLNLTQATAFKAVLTTTASALDTQAETSALAGLDCYYLNVEQTATCPADVDSVAATTGAGNPVVVAAGAVRSTLNQAAADADALALATAALVCVWTNTAQTATCNAGAQSPTSFTVDAGTVPSTVSRADANAQALLQAQASLVCLYPNAEQTATCAADEDLVAANTGDFNPVTVAAAAVLSAVSVADANAQALLQAQSLLRCEWGNQAQTATCPEDGEVPASEGASPVYTHTVGANAITSTISRADANAQALAFAQASLDCRYCNTEVAAKCATGESDDTTATVAAGTFCETTAGAAQALAEALAAIPVKVQTDGETCRYSNDRITAGCVGTDDSDQVYQFSSAPGLSGNSTPDVIVEAGTFVVTTNKADANALAKAFGLSLLSCFFESVAATFACEPDADEIPVSANATQPFTVAAGAFKSYVSLADANAARDTYGNSLLNCFWESQEQEFACAPDADEVPVATSATQPFTVADAMFISYTSRAEANALRDAYGNSLLDCFWESQEAEFACEPDADEIPVSANATQPFTVAAAAFTSYTSRAQANAARDVYGASLLNCFWENQEQEFACAPDADEVPVATSATQPFTVADAMFISYTSRAEANALRDAYGNSLLDCFWESQEAEFACGPDAQGIAVSAAATQPFTVAAAAFTSYTSRAQANAARDTYGNSLLNCFWESERAAVATCDSDSGIGSYPPYSSTPSGETITSVELWANSTQIAVDTFPFATTWTPLSTGTFVLRLVANTSAGKKLNTTPVVVTVVPSGGGAAGTDAGHPYNFRLTAPYNGAVIDVGTPVSVTGVSAALNINSVILEAGTTRSNGSLLDANRLRDVFALQSRSCLWHNAAQTAYCADVPDVLGDATFTVDAATVISYASKDAANDLAAALASASLKCEYGNDEKTGSECPEGTVALQAGIVAANTVRSPTNKAAANALAQTLADGLNVCVSEATLVGAGGGTGSTGPSGSCDELCGAFYS